MTSRRPNGPERGGNGSYEPTEARALNPEAGFHPVTTDPAELAAAMRANERSGERFPYYERRYGERGRRFGVSDGAWLLTLCSRSDAIEQVQWLGNTLSSRGIPRYLIEQHLFFLWEELPRTPRYAVLRQAARALRKERVKRLPHKMFEELADKFEQRVARVRGRVPAMGEILVAAVIDEALGVARAVPTVEEWACDPANFSTRWIAAVHQTIAAARARTLQRRS